MPLSKTAETLKSTASWNASNSSCQSLFQMDGLFWYERKWWGLIFASPSPSNKLLLNIWKHVPVNYYVRLSLVVCMGCISEQFCSSIHIHWHRIIIARVERPILSYNDEMTKLVSWVCFCTSYICGVLLFFAFVSRVLFWILQQCIAGTRAPEYEMHFALTAFSRY